MEASVNCLDGAYIIKLKGVALGGLDGVERCMSFFTQADGVRAVVIDLLQEFIGFGMEHEEVVELGIIVIFFDDPLDGSEPAFFVRVQFLGEVLLHMRSELRETGLVAHIPRKVVLDPVLKFYFMVEFVVSCKLVDCF